MIDENSAGFYVYAAQKLSELAMFREAREKITLFPNCYSIIAERKINNAVALGCVIKRYVVEGKYGEKILETDSRNIAGFNAWSISAIEAIFDCEVSTCNRLKYVDDEHTITEIEYEFVFVPVTDLFPNDGIYASCFDKKDESLREKQLFYHTFDEENAEANSYSDFEIFNLGNCIREAYGELLEWLAKGYAAGNINSIDTAYVPFYKYHGYLQPVIYNPLNRFLRPLPTLCGAVFTEDENVPFTVRAIDSDPERGFAGSWRIRQEAGRKNIIGSAQWKEKILLCPS